MNSASNGLTSVTSPFSIRKPVGSFIQPFTEITKNDPVMPAMMIGTPHEEVHARRQAVPAVDVDRDEDRLEEEREALEPERDAEHVAERRHELGPEQPELEREDRARHDADREQDRHRVRPALGQRLVERVPGTQPQALEEEHHRRERDAEADEWDVNGQRQRLHLTGLEQVLLLDRPAEDAVDHQPRLCPKMRSRKRNMLMKSR